MGEIRKRGSFSGFLPSPSAISLGGPARNFKTLLYFPKCLYYRKLKLRFHPDRLKREINRDLTEIEQKLATKIMQTLNLVLEGNRDGATSALDELRKLIKSYKSEESVDELVDKALTEKLEEIKLK